ncbi:MAG: hypothetical protein Q8910_00410 [Bacteroidota bacterium]|nr:hypothetical protein [Bacteroidota bacterium]
MALPIASAEMDVIIERESEITRSFTHKATTNTILLDNYGNVRKTPKIKVVAEGSISSLTITNTTFNCSIQINTSLVAGDTILIDDYRAFKNNVEIDVVFSAPFYIEENCINNIQFTIVGGSTINIDFTWKQPSGNVYKQMYVRRFSLNENKTFQRRAGGIIRPYKRGSVYQDSDYQFSLEKDWYFDDIFDDQDDTTYRIFYQTDETNADTGTLLQTYCLCGCRFESHQLNQQDGQIISESFSGFADRRFKIPRETANTYFLSAYQVIQE